MKKHWQALIFLGLITFLIVIRIPFLSSSGVINRQPNITIVQAQTSLPIQGEIAPTTSENIDQQDASVTFNGETLFTYSSQIQGFSAKKRAERATQEIEAIANNFLIPIDSLIIVKLEGLRVIATEEDSVFTLIEADAQAANRSLDELANEYLQKVKTAIAKYREQKEVKIPVRRIISAVMEVLFMIFLLILLKKILTRIYRQIERWKTNLLRPFRIQNLQIFSVDQEANLLASLAKLMYWGIVAFILFIYLSLLTRYVPQTEKLGDTILNHLYSLFLNAGRSAIAYLPNLFSILLTILVSAYIIRFCKLIFNAIDAGTLSIPGFYQDWAGPTERLVVVLIGAFTMVVIFPLLPGADSPAFRGISIFVGALFTLGGASAIANLVGGFIIIYTRAFQTGDRVQIADVKGDILEKTILSTRIRTTKNEIITMPNANLITSNIKNFTTAMRDIKQPLILYTTVTLGYDVPWRQVHQVLIQAALASPLILEKPVPFVLQTALGDFSVSYELNAYTNQPSQMPEVYSQLHQNIQDKCNEAGIEILSPQYSALRDGNQNTIPEDYLPQDYAAPGFRVNPLAQILNKSAHQGSQQPPPDNH